MVKPVILYGSEIWGFGKNKIIEKIHLKFCKLLLQLKPSTPSFMVYGETGRYPLKIDIKVRMISYWAKLIPGKQSKLSNILYNLNLCLSNSEGKKFVRLESVKMFSMSVEWHLFGHTDLIMSNGYL